MLNENRPPIRRAPAVREGVAERSRLSIAQLRRRRRRARASIYFPGLLDRAAQEALRDEIRAILVEAPPFRPRMPRTGKPFSVRMSNCGALGWVSDETRLSLPAGPSRDRPGVAGDAAAARSTLWARLAPGAPPPEACLINLYDAKAQMGLHQDRDEQDLAAPGRLAVARRYGAVPPRRLERERADPLVPPRIGRRDRVRRAGAARLPRRSTGSCRAPRPCSTTAGGST